LLKLSGLLALTIAALLALTAGSASAATTRPYESQITEADGSALGELFGLAVDNEDPVYVADTATRTLDNLVPA
jgi:hypothetical protein